MEVAEVSPVAIVEFQNVSYTYRLRSVDRTSQHGLDSKPERKFDRKAAKKTSPDSSQEFDPTCNPAIDPVAGSASDPAFDPASGPVSGPASGLAFDPASGPVLDPAFKLESEVDLTPTQEHVHGNALDDVSLQIEPGEFIAVIGANGSGKSTLAKHINALLIPQKGRVLTLGFDTSDPEVTFEIRSHAGMAFQNPDSQMVTSIVADDVAFGPENLAVPYTELVERVDYALDAVKMSEFAQRNPAHLSGGQKQRVCIAGVLAMKPDVLILDEPGAMLDARGRRGIRRIMRELNRGGMTVILITHFMEEAVIADRVFVMDKGSVVMSGPPSEVFSQKEKLRECNLDVPFSLLLAEELIKRGVPVSEIARPEELKEELWRWHLSR